MTTDYILELDTIIKDINVVNPITRVENIDDSTNREIHSHLI